VGCNEPFASRMPAAPARRIARIDDVPPGASLLFRYPTAEDPCILVRDGSGRFDAFSQVCTHLSCAVVHRPDEQALACPCHKGSFSPSDGRPLAGPPTRRLPRIAIDRAASISWRSGSRSDMETRQQGSTLFSAVLVLIATLVVIQLWLVAAAVLTLQAIASNRLAGIDYPLWALRDGPR
jgi:nitrite reductase/ring-hydroxylating ferredoxin subunit